MVRLALVSLVILSAAMLVVSGCGSNDSDTKKPAAAKSEKKTGDVPAPGTVFEGETSDEQTVTITVEQDGGARVKLGYVLRCNGTDLPQEADLGPFPIADSGKIEFANPGGDGALELAATLSGATATGTTESAAFEDSKLGSCEAVDATWTARRTAEGASATGASGGFEAGETLLESDFADGAEPWSELNDARAFIGVEDEAMRVNLRGTGAFGSNLAGDATYAKLTDIVMTATATVRASSQPKDSIGMSCRFTPDAGWGYNFYVAMDGSVGIFTNNGTEMTPLETGSITEPPKVGTAVEIGVACVAGAQQLFVDGKLVLESSDDSPWPNGTVALIAAGSADLDVIYDDVVLSKPA